jgi:hypothetical protein
MLKSRKLKDVLYAPEKYLSNNLSRKISQYVGGASGTPKSVNSLPRCVPSKRLRSENKSKP